MRLGRVREVELQPPRVKLRIESVSLRARYLHGQQQQVRGFLIGGEEAVDLLARLRELALGEVEVGELPQSLCEVGTQREGIGEHLRRRHVAMDAAQADSRVVVRKLRRQIERIACYADEGPYPLIDPAVAAE